jgi:RNA polymerase sigma factor (sigma-70 family)
VESLLASDRRSRGLDEPTVGQAGDGATVAELLADPGAEEPYESATDRVLVADLPRLLSGLTDRQRAVVCARFGIGAPQQTLREVAGTLGVSAERVRQIEETALERLHEAACAA